MGCPYTFETMLANYPRKADYPSRTELYTYLGWSKIKPMMESKEWENTCAIRVSVCLIRCGMTFNTPPIGAMVQNSCPDKKLRGQAVILGFKRMAEILKAKWGDPEVVKPVSVATMNDKKGMVVFWKLNGGYPGHIDLLRDTKAGEEFEGEYGSAAYEAESGWYWAGA
jgi:hypothetical protein